MNFIFYLTLLFFILLFSTIDCNIDFDFWARLIVGKSFFQTGTLFNNDFYSYGTTHEFIDHEWGSSLVFYLIQSNFGDVGLYLFKALLIFFTFFIVSKIIRLEKKNIKLHFLFFFFIIHSICYTLFSTVRCQSFSFLFFVLYLYILKYVQKTKNYRVLWCLPVLNIIWQNMHGGFVLGLSLIFIFAIGQFLNERKTKEYLLYLSAFLASFSATLINPYGIKYLYYIFNAFRLNRTYITEWKSAFFDKLYYFSLLKFKIALIILIVIFLIFIIKQIKNKNFINHFKNVDKIKYIILIFTLVLAIKVIRCHVFFALSLISLCYCDFYNIFNKKLPKTIDNIKEIILFILITISLLSHLQNYKFINYVKESVYPIYCIEFLKINGIKGNLFTNFHNGSYAAYKLYPDNYVFMDGRYEEVYDTNLINKMAKVFLAQNQGDFFKNFHSDILILDKTYPIVNELKNSDKYFLAFEDDYFCLYLLNRFKKEKFITPTSDLNYYNKTKFITKIDWNDI